MEIKLKNYEAIKAVTTKDEILSLFHSEKVVYDIDRWSNLLGDEYLCLSVSIILDSGVEDFIFGTIIKEYTVVEVASLKPTDE